MQNCSPLLRIYEGVYSLMVFKRRLFEELAITQLPPSPLNDEKPMTSTKIFLCLKKLASEVKSQLTDLAKHGKFESHLVNIGQSLMKLKSNNDFLTQEEKLLTEAAGLITDWRRVSDPLIYYEQGQRGQLFGKLTSKLRQISAASTVARQTRKPLYIRKLQRQLRDNLELVSDQERKYNKFQEAVGDLIRKKIGKVIGKLLEGINKTPRNSLVEEEKNDLLKKYIDIFNSSQGVKQKDQANYRKDIGKVAKNAAAVFINEKRCYQLLVAYLRALLGKLQSIHRSIIAREDEVARHTCGISQDINSALCFEESLEIFGSAKDFLSFDALQAFIDKVEKLEPTLDQAIDLANDFCTRVKQREGGRQNIVEIFIADKKFLETLMKRQSSFENSLYQFFVGFLETFVQKLNQGFNRETKSDEIFKLRAEKVFQKLFTTYFEESEAFEKKNQPQNQNQNQQPLSSTVQSSSYSNKVRQIQLFLKQLSIFQQNTDWSQCFQCSLGPKLLIHGRLKIFPSGIYYESNFNKKNLFFGKTRLFIPREDIYEINKETALVIFADVVEIVTKKGQIYFHALGKRDQMCRELNDQFFPEINNPHLLDNDIPFNNFDGSSSFQENRIKPYLNKLEYEIQNGKIANIDFRTFFHKYESDKEFVHQGKTYKDFKHFTISLAEGTNINGTNFTPHIPSYLTPHVSTSIDEFDEQPIESQRFFTYEKNVPMIPLVSKGGSGLCKQKSIYHWGGPKCLVIDIFTTLSGFSLTQGMTVQSRRVYREVNNSIQYELSGAVSFESNSAVNSLLRTPALANLKSLHNEVFQIIKKLEKNKRPKSLPSMKKIILGEEEQKDSQQNEIVQLKKENQSLRKTMKVSTIAVLCLYLITVIFLIL